MRADLNASTECNPVTSRLTMHHQYGISVIVAFLQNILSIKVGARREGCICRLQLQVFLIVVFACPFLGLELASNLGPNIANQGSIYLRNLICDKVCRARKIKQQESNQVADRLCGSFKKVF